MLINLYHFLSGTYMFFILCLLWDGPCTWYRVLQLGYNLTPGISRFKPFYFLYVTLINFYPAILIYMSCQVWYDHYEAALNSTYYYCQVNSMVQINNYENRYHNHCSDHMIMVDYGYIQHNHHHLVKYMSIVDNHFDDMYL